MLRESQTDASGFCILTPKTPVGSLSKKPLRVAGVSFFGETMTQLAFDFYEPLTGRECTVCGEWKPFSEFYKAKSGLYGVRCRCKKCDLALCHEYQSKHRKELRAYYRKYHAKHRKRRNAESRQYYVEHREEILARNREYNAAHREEKRVYNHEYYIKHRQERLEYSRQYEADHPEIRRNYRNKNRERRRIYNRQWATRNPDKMRAKWARRRARRKQAPGNLTIEEEQRLYELYDHCLCCDTTEDLTLDHIVPLAEGGAHSFENCQILCRPCNSSKGTQTIDYR